MKAEDIKLGMKVIPHTKSYAGSFKSSIHVGRAKDRGQEYLYVNAFVPSQYYILGADKLDGNAHAGDFFKAEDFEPYEDNQD